MSVNAQNSTNASDPYGAEHINANKNQISPKPIEDWIMANLEPLNEQMLSLTHLLNQLIQDISAKITRNGGFAYPSPSDWTLTKQGHWSLENLAQRGSFSEGQYEEMSTRKLKIY